MRNKNDIQLAEGEGKRGRGRSKQSLVFYESFKTLWLYLY
jgi:hypothetical protein